MRSNRLRSIDFLFLLTILAVIVVGILVYPSPKEAKWKSNTSAVSKLHPVKSPLPRVSLAPTSTTTSSSVPSQTAPSAPPSSSPSPTTTSTPTAEPSTSASSTGLDPTLYAEWTKVAVCEEGGWVGYSGAAYPDSLGINATNWNRFGGTSDVSPGAQIAVAERLVAYYGAPIPDQNGCAGSW